MARRIDLLKSWVRSAAEAGKGRLRALDSVTRIRETLDELKERRVTIGEAALSSAVAHAPDVKASTVSARDGRLVVDVTGDDDSSTIFAVVPEQVRFAPRGAKEVLFRVDPPELARDTRVRDAVGCLAAAIARALWGPVLSPRSGDEQALVETDNDHLRVDLRTVPAVRAALEGSPLAMALDVLTIESFTIEARALRIKVGLPLPPL